jgi:hypothetical protein
MLVFPDSDALTLPVTEDWRTLVRNRSQRAWGRWNHQYRAFEFLELYYDNHRSHERPNAALIRMPTGSGKTGVMAIATGFGRDMTTILLVVPSAALADQVSRAVAGQHWIKLGRRPRSLPTVFHFTPSSLEDDLAGARDSKSARCVFVCTTTTLAMLGDDESGRWVAAYASLRDRVVFVVVDEGHREPAPSWAKAIRSFRRPTILFSATPYRNDVRLFNLGRRSADSGNGAHLYQVSAARTPFFRRACRVDRLEA